MTRSILPSTTALQCFEAVARHLSFTRAADELFLTQSAVSKQVAQLEELLQHQLFSRARRHLKLTPAGVLYLAEVTRILNQVDSASRYILSYGSETQVLKVATQPTFGARWLIPQLQGFNDQHPNIHLDILNQLEPFDLQQGKADILFFFGQGSWPGATCIELFGEDVVPVCAPGLCLAENIEEALQNESLTLLQCTSRPEVWQEWFQYQGLQMQQSYQGPRFETFYMCICAAQARLGVAMVPRYLVAQELEEGKLVIPWGNAMPSSGAHYLAFPENAGEVPKIKKFIAWILARDGVARHEMQDLFKS